VQNFIELAEGTRNWQDRVSGEKGPGPLYTTPFPCNSTRLSNWNRD
jgi:hypothetical protein